jgi:hypothetical protein
MDDTSIANAKDRAAPTEPINADGWSADPDQGNDKASPKRPSVNTAIKRHELHPDQNGSSIP